MKEKVIPIILIIWTLLCCAISVLLSQNKELKEKAYDSNGIEYKTKYEQLDKQYHTLVHNMNELGYDLSIG